MLYVITRPFAFIAIKHVGLQRSIFGIPICCAVIVTFIYVYLPVAPNLIGQDGVISNLLGAASILPGFFFAALAAVSTADRVLLDKTMPDPSPKLNFSTGDKKTPLDLTFRVFLSFLFSYVTVLSFALLIVIVIADVVAPSISSILLNLGFEKSTAWLQRALVFLVTMIVAQLAVCTSIGLYFLTERLNRP